MGSATNLNIQFMNRIVYKIPLFKLLLFRPRRMPIKSCTKGLLFGNDPYLVDAIADTLFPQLSIESSRFGGNTSLQLVTLGTGDKTVTLPSLTLEQNYPQMLSELVTHI